MQHTLDIIIAVINVLFCAGYVYLMLSKRFAEFTAITKAQLQIRSFRWISLVTYAVGLILNWVLFYVVWDMPYTLWTTLVGCAVMAVLIVYLYAQGLKAQINPYPYSWK